MKSNASGNDRVQIRPLLVWTAVLLLIIIIAVLNRPPSQPAAQQPTEAQTTNAVSNASVMKTISPSHPSTRPPQSETEPETARLISLMSDKSLTLQIRRQAARSLGKIGTDEAMAALKTALTNDSPPYLKAAIAEGLGASPNAEARDLLHELVNGKDQTTARAAARGLAARGDADAVDTLGNLLFNDQTPLSVRTEAALALGDVSLPSAQDQLTRAITQIQDDDVRESVLDGLGRRPFSNTEGFFRDYLNSTTVPPESKVLAIEAIRDAEGNVAPFLSNYLNDPNPDVRAAAKQALDFLSPNPTPAPGTR
jgi:HEAT repeat protein